MILAFSNSNEDGLFDIFVLLTIFLVNAGIFFGRQPLYGWWNNLLGRFNNFAMLVCTYHLLMFTDAVDKHIQYQACWSLITTVLIFITVNLMYFFMEILVAIDRLLKMWKGFGLLILLGPIIKYLKGILEFVKMSIKELFDWIRNQIKLMCAWI